MWISTFFDGFLYPLKYLEWKIPLIWIFIHIFTCKEDVCARAVLTEPRSSGSLSSFRWEMHPAHRCLQHIPAPCSQLSLPISFTTGLLKAMSFLRLRFNTRSSLIRRVKVITHSWAGLTRPRWDLMWFSPVNEAHIKMQRRSGFQLFSDLEGTRSQVFPGRNPPVTQATRNIIFILRK